MHGITGVTGAAPVLHDVFTHLREQRGTSWFAVPEGIRDYTVHPLTGRSVAVGQPGTVTEKCLWPPEAERSADFDASGRVVLPPEYTPWLASPQNGLGDLATSANFSPSLRILNPPPGAIYFLDPDLPADAQWVPLRAESPGEVEWSCASMPCAAAGPRQRANLRVGRHVISARDATTGRMAETWIEVREL